VYVGPAPPAPALADAVEALDELADEEVVADEEVADEDDVADEEDAVAEAEDAVAEADDAVVVADDAVEETAEVLDDVDACTEAVATDDDVAPMPPRPPAPLAPPVPPAPPAPWLAVALRLAVEPRGKVVVSPGIESSCRKEKSG
jgi:hypothetical protein